MSGVARRRLFDLIEVSQNDNKASVVYDIFMMLSIVISIIPLAFTEENICFIWIDRSTVAIFILDYILRFVCADIKLKKGWKSFFIYPLTPMAIVDLIAILPSISLMTNTWKLLKIVRLIRTLRVFRVLKAVRYSKSIDMFIPVFKKEKEPLTTIFGIAVIYILISALVVLNIEPETFGNYFHAVYWATISLTTMGYGDIYPVTTAGQLVTMISSIVGIAIVAMPAGVITAGFMQELNSENEDKKEA